jgi:hypothetical protein
MGRPSKMDKWTKWTEEERVLGIRGKAQKAQKAQWDCELIVGIKCSRQSMYSTVQDQYGVRSKVPVNVAIRASCGMYCMYSVQSTEVDKISAR